MSNVVTESYKTRSEIIERKMPRVNGNNQYKAKTIVALDIGYSSVKGASPNRVFMFPSYCKKASKDLEVIGKVRPEDIQFRDNTTGEIWLVGQSAQALMTQTDVAATTDISLYTRYRYKSENFKVWALTGMCLGLWGTGAGNEIFLQTGLPAEYKARDTKPLIDALVGDYDVSVKVGNNDWVDFKFSLDADHIDVMEQPKGTLCSVVYDDGVLTDLGKQIMGANSMILDIGFGTEDIFPIRTGYKEPSKTYPDTGMRATFEAVISDLIQNYPIDIKIFEFQKYLEEGKASYFDNNDFRVYDIDFTEQLVKANTELCDKSLKRMLQEYANMMDYQYLIVTGGTGESRYKQIEEFFKTFKVTVLPGNLNTKDLSFQYSNVIGYYMFRHAKHSAEAKKAMQS